MSNYPSDLDTDADIPRIDDNITEIGGETINSLREAIFAIQEVLGLNPQGSTASVVERLNAIQNPDGTFKASAITAAGLIALPIVNSQIGGSAAIEESKLDLSVATQVLQDQITSNDIDIEELQDAINEILNRLAQHIAGTNYKHDGFDIYLDKTSPTVTPPAFTSLTSTDVSNAIIEINNRFLAHVDSATLDVHDAASITVVDNFITISATDAQTAFEELDQLRAREFITHRDEMHANGFGNWANNPDGYSDNSQLVPAELGETVLGQIPAVSDRKRITIDGYTLASFGVTEGDILLIKSPTDLVGQYIIDDVGPRDPVGTKALLENTDLEITTTFPYVAGETLSDAVTTFDGYVSLAIYGQSSVGTFQGNCASTIHQSGTAVDSVQVARPNAARIHSLGLDTKLITGSETLVLEVGIASGVTRSITLTNLNRDRNGSVVSEVTPTTIVERINSVFQNAADGYNFPAAAYRVGDEFVIAHNWQDSINYTLTVTSSGTGNFLLGLDGYGADVVDKIVRPTQSTYYYVNGSRYLDFASIASGTATATGTQTIIVTGFNPQVAGVRAGHLLHVTNHPTAAENGSYFITSVTNNTIDVHKSAGIAAGSFDVQIIHDAVPLDEFRNSAQGQIIEVYLDQNGRLNQNNRLEYSLVANLEMTDVSDNFLPGSYELTSTVNPTADYVTFQMGSFAKSESLPRDFEGTIRVPGPSNIDFIELSVTNPVDAGTSNINVNEHIDEEEFLEVCSVLFDGTLLLSDLKDKRLFGSTGLDEIREDYTQARIEVPQSELRSNGLITGFDIIDGYYTDTSYLGQFGLLIRGGTAYVGGVRCDIPTTPVMFPNTAGTFYVSVNERGTFKVFEENSPYTIAELLDGYGGEQAFIARVEHNGIAIIQENTEDLRYFINNIDDKLDVIVDATNNRIGNFASFEAALRYVENYPQSEKFKIKIVSNTNDLITVNSSRDITLEIDGRVGGVTIDTPCRIFSNSIANRTEPHIDGYLNISSTCTEFIADGLNLRDIRVDFVEDGLYEFRGCQFRGDGVTEPSFISSNTPNVRSISFYDCFFDSTYGDIDFGLLAFFNGLLRFVGCVFDGGAGAGKVIRGSAEYVILDGCRFNNWGYLQGFGEHVAISNCIFENMTSSLTDLVTFDFITPLNTGGATAAITNCHFENLTAGDATLALINCTPAGQTRSSITNCYFESCDVSIGAILVNIQGSIIGSKFNANIHSSSVGIEATTFESNELITGATDPIVQAQIFKGNENFRVVIPAADNVIISNNNFASPVDTSLAIIDIDARAEVVISGNTFEVSSNVNAIQFGTNSYETVITGNVFDGNGALSVGIDLEDAGGISNTTQTIISDNLFKECTAITTSTDNMSNLTITGNQMNYQPITLRLGTDVIFSENLCDSVTLTSSGIMSNIVLQGNIFEAGHSLTIDNTMTDSAIQGNIGEFVINSTMQNMVFSGNKGDLSFGASAVCSSCIFSENVFDTFTSSTNTWLNTLVSGNVFVSGADIILQITARIQFENNIINGANILVNGTPTSSSISSNVSISGVPNITVSSTLAAALISRNISYSIDIQSGSDNSIISLNSGGSIITLEGTVNSTTVDSNTVTNLVADCNSTTALSIKNNRIFSGLSIFSTSGTYSIANMSVLNNTVSGNLVVGAGLTGTDVQSVTTSIFGNNIVTDISIFDVDASSATRTFSDNTISGNNVANILILGTTAHQLGPSTMDNVSIQGNQTSAKIIIGGATAATTPITYNNLTIGGNNVSSNIEYLVGNGCDGLNIVSNSCGGIDLNFYDGTDVYDNILISGNQNNSMLFITADGSPTVTNLFVTNNLMPGANVAWELENTHNTLTVQNMIFSGNTLRSFQMQNNSVSTSLFFLKNIKFVNNTFTLSTGTTPATGVNIDMQNKSVNSLINNFFFVGNTLDEEATSSPYAEVKFANPSTLGGDLVIDTIGFSNNVDFDFVLDQGATGSDAIQINGANIANNIFNRLGGLTRGIRLDNPNDGLEMDTVVIANNLYANIDIGGAASMQEWLITGNTMNQVDIFGDGLQDMKVIGNELNVATVGTSSSLSRMTFVGNSFISFTINKSGSPSLLDRMVFMGNTATTFITFDRFEIQNSVISGNLAATNINFTDCTAIERMVFANNYAGTTITLPANADFTTDTDSKFFGNHAGSYSVDGAGTFSITAAGAGTTGTNTKIAWGNTAGGATAGGTITVTEATTRSISNFNNFAGSIL